MTTTRDELRKLAENATPGPWEVHGSLIGVGRAKPDFGQTWGLRWKQDIELICAARTALPALLDQLDAAEARIRDLTQEVRDERAAALDQIEQVRIRDARIARLTVQSDVRRRAVTIYQDRAREAEQRIRAVQDVIDDLEQQPADQIGWDAAAILPDIRRALEA